MYYVYILQSLKDNRTYVGYTQNITNRLHQHNNGEVRATANRQPFKLLYLEECQNLIEAKSRENYWKSGGGRRKLKKYFLDGFPPRLSSGRGSPK
ncbi:GIY-YIG nuclease family protein [Candidatus Wolfebacteria bacterium]|nr:GIY-YIG nuclease family protein [Candidatus Wolfebacteria bacterium]